MYSLLLYIHIFSVILAIGPFFVLLPLISKMRSASQNELLLYLDSYTFVIQLSKHAGHILVLSGILLIWVGSWNWSTSWIVMTVVILLGALFFIARAFSPIVKKLKIEKDDRNRVILLHYLKRSLFLYMVIMLVMMWLMVAKPTLW